MKELRQVPVTQLRRGRLVKYPTRRIPNDHAVARPVHQIRHIAQGARSVDDHARDGGQGLLAITAHHAVDERQLPHDLLSEHGRGETAEEDARIRRPTADCVGGVDHRPCLLMPVQREQHEPWTSVDKVAPQREVRVELPLDAEVQQLDLAPLVCEHVREGRHSQRHDHDLAPAPPPPRNMHEQGIEPCHRERVPLLAIIPPRSSRKRRCRQRRGDASGAGGAAMHAPATDRRLAHLQATTPVKLSQQYAQSWVSLSEDPFTPSRHPFAQQPPWALLYP